MNVTKAEEDNFNIQDSQVYDDYRRKNSMVSSGNKSLSLGGPGNFR